MVITKGREEKTLYERLGGDEDMRILTINFIDEAAEHPKLYKMLKNVPLSVLGHHQVNLFRVLFGPEEKRPNPDCFLDYMLATHVRMFRDYGLNEEHFDLVAVNLVTGLQTLQKDQKEIDEVVELLTPLRAVFEYGAKVASKEKGLTEEERAMLPKASAQTIGTNEMVALRDPAFMDIPAWLPETLKKYSSESKVRAWTCELTQQFGPAGDKDIADTFMDMPYMNHHVYLVAFLQLAFLPDGEDSSELLGMVRFPRGPMNPPLCLALWNRMIAQFVRTAKNLFMDTIAITRAVNKLRSYSDHFPDVAVEKVNGLKAPHLLQQFVAPESDAVQPLLMNGQKGAKNDFDATTVCSSTSGGSGVIGSHHKKGKKMTQKRVWRRLFGWITVGSKQNYCN